MLIKAYNIAIPLDKALEIRDFVGFVKLLRAQIIKNFVVKGGRTKKELDIAINQIVSRAIATEEIIDLFKAIGLKKPDISILSPEEVYLSPLAFTVPVEFLSYSLARAKGFNTNTFRGGVETEKYVAGSYKTIRQSKLQY